MSTRRHPAEELPYEDRQRLRDREYLEAWRRLPSRDRKRLQKAGLAPEPPSYRTAKPDTEATLERTSMPSQDADESEAHNAFPMNQEVLRAAYRRLVGEILYNDRPALTLDCLALVTNIAYDGSTQADIAQRHGLTRAAVSKRCIQLTEVLGLPPSRAMRSLTVRQAYAERAHRVHQRSA
jgi:hypothetical protein